MTDTKLSEKKATNIMVNLLCNKLFILAPLYFKQSTGFSAIIVTTIVFILATIIWNIYCKFTQNQLYDLISNNIIKHTIILLIATISMLITATTIQQYSQELKSTVLNTTPLWIISVIFLTTMLSAFKYRLENIGTVSAIFVPTIFFVAVALVAISTSRDDLYNLFPLLDLGYNSIFKKFLLMSAMLFELIFLFFMPEILDKNTNLKKVGNHIILRCYIYYLVISVVLTIVFPATEISEPFFKIIKHAHIGKTTVKFDSIFLMLYCISAFIYVSSMILLTIRIIKSSLHNIVTCVAKPLLISLTCVTALNSDIAEAVYNHLTKRFYILSFITFALPIILITNKVLICRLKK